MRRRELSWSLIDQGFCSATSLGLTIAAGRLLGPGGLGLVSVGLAAYLFLQALQRSLVSDPLSVCTASQAEGPAFDAVAHGLTVTVAGGLAFSVLTAAGGIALGGHVGHSLILFAPWAGVALVQDFWRSALFRLGRGRSATINDAIRALVMTLCLVAVWRLASDWALVSAWGLGAAVGTTLGFAQTRQALRRPRLAWRWWTDDALKLGRWLGLEAVVVSGSSLCLTVILVSLLGDRDVGGLRAVITLFTPMTFLGQAIELPGLPRLARLCQSSIGAARLGAFRLSGAAVSLVCAYLLVAIPLRGSLLAAVYGDRFRAFEHLFLPVATSDLLYAVGIGLVVLLKAEGRGSARALSQTLAEVTTLLLVWRLAAASGVWGAAWGLAAGVAVGQGAASLLALTPHRRRSDTSVVAAAPPLP